MSIGFVELNGGIQRTQDYATVKHNEEHRVVVDQSNIQTQFSKQVQEKSTRVKRGDDAQNTNQRHDAKEKGKNEYYGDGGRRRQKENGMSADGRVIPKNSSGFDMKI